MFQKDRRRKLGAILARCCSRKESVFDRLRPFEVLKTAARKGLQVRVLSPPPFLFNELLGSSLSEVP
jgi:hypothetical protein